MRRSLPTDQTPPSFRVIWVPTTLNSKSLTHDNVLTKNSPITASSARAWANSWHLYLGSAGNDDSKRIRSWVYRAAVKNQDKVVGLQKGSGFKTLRFWGTWNSSFDVLPRSLPRLPSPRFCTDLLHFPSKSMRCAFPPCPVPQAADLWRDCAHIVLRILSFLLVWVNRRNQHLTRGCGDREKGICIPGPEAQHTGSSTCFLPLAPQAGWQWLLAAAPGASPSPLVFSEPAPPLSRALLHGTPFRYPFWMSCLSLVGLWCCVFFSFAYS